MTIKRPQLGKSDEVSELPLACSSEAEAVKFLERKRWGDAPCCPRCGSTAVYAMKDRKTGERSRRFLWRCRDCTGKQTQFTVRTNSVFEESLLPLRLWCRAYWEAASCKNGVSALELARKLQVTHKTALFVLNRLRHGMVPTKPDKLEGVIEIDEVYLGGRARPPNGVPKAPVSKIVVTKEKTPVMAIIQRDGPIRTVVMTNVTAANARQVILNNVDPSRSMLMTDGAWFYTTVGKPFVDHLTCNHRKGEYCDPKNNLIHVNTAESFFARVRRAIDGTWIAVSVEHLPRYLAHVGFLMETSKMTDGERVGELIRRSNGKRLRYKEPA